MAKTISANQSAFILSNAGDNPLTVAANITVAGGGYGIYATNSQAWSITNLGTVTGFGADGAGVEFKGAGVLSNGNVGLVSGSSFGVYAGGAITVTNAGGITATVGDGFYLKGGGTITNSGTGARISGASVGIVASSGAATTVINQGTIAGGSTAVRFGNVNGNLFREFPGAVVSGAVQGGSGSDTLALGFGAATGTIAGIGGQFTGFEVLAIDPAANWVANGANTLAAWARSRSTAPLRWRVP